MKSVGSILLTVFVLVGLPVGVAVVAHETKPAAHHLSAVAVEVRQIKAKLRRAGATNITCSWTVSGSDAAVSCSGDVGGNSKAGVDAFVIGQDSR